MREIVIVAVACFLIGTPRRAVLFQAMLRRRRGAPNVLVRIQGKLNPPATNTAKSAQQQWLHETRSLVRVAV
jgi:hypothetical protein